MNYINKSVKVETLDNIKKEKEVNKLTIQLINFNINQGSEYHVNNIKIMTLNQKKNKTEDFDIL